MKKLFLTAAVMVLVGFASSCKKDCFCSWKGDLVPDAMKAETNVGQFSKKDCEAQTPTIPLEMEGVSFSCEAR